MHCISQFTLLMFRLTKEDRSRQAPCSSINELSASVSSRSTELHLKSALKIMVIYIYIYIYILYQREWETETETRMEPESERMSLIGQSSDPDFESE